MQSHIANAQIVLHYKNGDSEPTDLINPYNYDDGIGSFGYYHYSDNEMVELGEKTHADVISLPMAPDKELVAVEVHCLSDQILFGVLGKRATAIYLSTISVMAVIFGLVVDRVYASLDLSAAALAGRTAEAMPV